MIIRKNFQNLRNGLRQGNSYRNFTTKNQLIVVGITFSHLLCLSYKSIRNENSIKDPLINV